MLDVFRKLLFEREPDAAGVPSAQRAVAALLAAAADIDGAIQPREQRLIETFLADAFDLDAAAATALRLQGEADHVHAADLVRFTRVIKTGLDEQERCAVLEALWRVVLSDGRRDPREDALMRRLAPLLALTDHDSARARQRVTAPG